VILNKKSIMITLQFIICVLIGIEVSFEPNPYIHQLVIIMTIYIILKHNLDNKLLNIWEKYFG